MINYIFVKNVIEPCAAQNFTLQIIQKNFQMMENQISVKNV